MNEKELLMKERRLYFWERYHVLPTMDELISSMELEKNEI
jgi:hypothetical protein